MDIFSSYIRTISLKKKKGCNSALNVNMKILSTALALKFTVQQTAENLTWCGLLQDK